MNLRQSKLFHFLEHFMESEGAAGLSRFSSYLSSEYLQPDRQIQRFFDIFRTQVLEKQANDGHAIYEAAFPNSQYSANHLRERMSTLLRHFMDFLALENFRSDSQSRTVHLVQSMMQQRQHKYLLAMLSARLHELSSQPLHDDSTFYQMLALEHERVAYSIHHLPRDGSVSFGLLHELLDTYYAIRKLRYARLAVAYQREHGTPCKVPAMGTFLRYLEDRRDELHPLAKCFLLAYECTTGAWDEARFKLFLSMIEANAPFFGEAVAKEIFNAALGFCEHRINQGQDGWLEQSLDLYRLFFHDVLEPKGWKVPQTLLKNYVTLLVQAGRFSEAQTVFHTMAKLTLGRADSRAMQMSKALLHFAAAEYVEARRMLDLLLDGNQDVFFGIGARAYLWMTDYLLEDWDAFESRYHMFRTFLAAQKVVSPEYRDNFVKYSRAMRKLGNAAMQLQLGKKRIAAAKLAQLGTLISESKHMIHRTWLRHQIEALQSQGG